jgi:hypothetical protein
MDADQADKRMRIVAAETVTDAALTFKQRCDDCRSRTGTIKPTVELGLR